MTKVLVLGLGLQGKAVIHDLEQSDLVSEVFVADMDPQAMRGFLEHKGYRKCRAVGLDAAREGALLELIETVAPKITISMLPADFNYAVARAALTAGCSFVSSSDAGRVAELDAEARAKGVALLPEMGMDPGIDLVLGRWPWMNWTWCTACTHTGPAYLNLTVPETTPCITRSPGPSTAS